MKIAIGISNHGDTICSDFFWNFQALLTPSNASMMVFRGDGTFKVSSLNEIVRQSLAWGADYIFFMDYDIVFPQDTLMKLLNHNLDIVGGLYHTKVPPFAPVAGWVDYKEGIMVCVNQNKNLWKFDFAQFPEGDKNGLVEVDWTGIGCLLVKTKVFKDIGWERKKLYDVFNEQLGHRTYGHDVNLCTDAKKVGYKVFIDRTINCGHTMVFAIDESWIRAFYDSGMNVKWLENEKIAKSGADYWNRIWSIEGINTPSRTYPQEFDLMVNTIKEGSTVADIGCGLSKILYRLKNEKKCDCFGYDFSKIAIEKNREYGIKGEVVNILDLNDYADSENQSEYVICNHVLEHFEKEDRETLLTICMNYCQPGGTIFINVPNSGVGDYACLEHRIKYDKETLAAEIGKVFKEFEIFEVGHSFMVKIKNHLSIG